MYSLMKYVYFLFIVCLVSCFNEQERDDKPLCLWYNSPAENWNEAFPVGNGRIGAMVFGGIDKEVLQLNENTLYSGEPSIIFKDVQITPKMKDKVVELMRAKKYSQASDLICKYYHSLKKK